MLIRWFGQSAFLLADGDRRVAIDPFESMEGLARRGMRFDYPPIERIARPAADQPRAPRPQRRRGG
jgi:L-ascorbate metabolism protein UlaG (beta-lactamase superfamily)